MKKTKRVRFLSREQVEKAFQAAVGSLRKIKGFVSVEVKATVRVHDDLDSNKAVVLQSKHAI